MSASTIPPFSVWTCGTPFGNTQEGPDRLRSAQIMDPLSRGFGILTRSPDPGPWYNGRAGIIHFRFPPSLLGGKGTSHVGWDAGDLPSQGVKKKPKGEWRGRERGGSGRRRTPPGLQSTAAERRPRGGPPVHSRRGSGVGGPAGPRSRLHVRPAAGAGVRRGVLGAAAGWAGRDGGARPSERELY